MYMLWRVYNLIHAIYICTLYVVAYTYCNIYYTMHIGDTRYVAEEYKELEFADKAVSDLTESDLINVSLLLILPLIFGLIYSIFSYSLGRAEEPHRAQEPDWVYTMSQAPYIYNIR